MRIESVALLALTLTACSPITPYRTSVGVPVVAPPSTVGAPVAGGTLGLGAGFAGDALGPRNFAPERGDPGLYTSPYLMNAWARVGIADAIELGVAGEYAPGGAMRQGAVGVLPMPGDTSVSGISGWATGGYMWDRFGFGITLEGTRMSMPYARFTYVGPEAYLDDGYYIGPDEGLDGLYDLTESGRVHPVRVRGAGTFQARVKGWEFAGGLAVCPVFTNNGFSEAEVPIFRSGGLAMGPVLDVGYDFGVMRVGAQGWYMPGAARPTRGFDQGMGARLSAEVRSDELFRAIVRLQLN